MNNQANMRMGMRMKIGLKVKVVTAAMVLTLTLLMMLLVLALAPLHSSYANAGNAGNGNTFLTSSLKVNKIPPVLLAYQQAYPTVIREIRLIRGEWALVTYNGTTLYWANGRILPKDLKDDWKTYRSYVYYTYPLEIPNPAKIEPKRVASLNRYAQQTRKTSKSTYQEGSFAKELYGANTADGIAEHIVDTRLFGRKIRIHSLVEPHLTKVNDEVYRYAEIDPETKAFLDGIKSVWGYNWRDISGTMIISYHSYGLAVDILPYNPSNKVIYWQWASRFRDDWLQVPLRERWSPPESVIRIFENNGFIWGGKWTLYDTMHFEYRPEMLILAK